MNELLLAVVLSWSVVDGDTVDIRARVWPSVIVDERVRFLRIDAPEVHRPAPDCERALGAKATEYTRAALAAGKTIIVRGNSRDSFGRVLGEVYVDGVNLNDRMLAAGVARPYGTKTAWCT